MSLEQPDLYIAGRKIAAGGTVQLLAQSDLQLTWGGDNRFDFEPPATLAGRLLVRGPMPEWLDVGASVGLIDPVSARCLFAGYMEPLRATISEQQRTAMNVSFTAAAPKSELEKHTVLDLDWPEESANSRRARIGSALPRGWGYGGDVGDDWVKQGPQRFQSIDWLTLAGRYARGNLQRIHDVSSYVPGYGIRKRIDFTAERYKNVGLSWAPSGARGAWLPDNPGGATGTAILPGAAIGTGIIWEKTPADVVTAVQVTTWGGALLGSNNTEESLEHEWPIDWVEDFTAEQDAYGFRQQRVETAISPQQVQAAREQIGRISRTWMDTQTKWRPTTLPLPDSRRLNSAPLLNLLAVDSRHMAAVTVPAAGAGLPGEIRSFVLGGSATWTGKKWTTDLTLGRTQ